MSDFKNTKEFRNLLNEVNTYIEENYQAEEPINRLQTIPNYFRLVDSFLTTRRFIPSNLVVDGTTLNKGKSFGATLYDFEEKKHMKPSAVYDGAGISNSLYNAYKRNERTPGWDKVYSIAVTMKLDINETTELLSAAGLSFRMNNEFDIIVKYFIERRIYDVDKINDVLFERSNPNVLCIPK